MSCCPHCRHTKAGCTCKPPRLSTDPSLTCEEIYALALERKCVEYHDKKTPAAFVIGWPVREVLMQIAAGRLRRLP